MTPPMIASNAGRQASMRRVRGEGVSVMAGAPLRADRADYAGGARA